MTQEDVSELIKRMADGDPDAFEAVYRMTCEDIYRTVLFLVNDRYDAVDIVSDIYMNVWKTIGSYDTSKPFRYWLHGLALRRVGHYRRGRWRTFRLFEKQKAYMPIATGMNDDQLLRREGRDELLAHVFRLSYKLRAVIILRFFHEYSLEEIAALLQIPIGTVKSRQHLALRQLRNVMDPLHERKAENPYVY
ncbi:sigma-70 family RNA polymerase sigma factor [Paenibacillus sp. MBLB4367]|uniref:sigma-70 family RNA polymerase sigma factor n=1 Tax=Paenibacillus sp. MBLB4367 TaxID=3384767 RepID=UPI003908130B